MASKYSLLSSAQIEQLLNSDLKEYSRAGALRGLLEAVAASLRASEEQTRKLHSDVSRIASAKRSSEGPLAAAVTALAALSAEEQSQVLDVWASGLVETLHAEQAEARQRTLAAVSALARTKMAVSTVIEHPDTPENVRQLGIQALERMPDLTVIEPVAWDLSTRPTTGFTVPPKIEEEEVLGEKGLLLPDGLENTEQESAWPGEVAETAAAVEFAEAGEEEAADLESLFDDWPEDDLKIEQTTSLEDIEVKDAEQEEPAELTEQQEEDFDDYEPLPWEKPDYVFEEQSESTSSLGKTESKPSKVEGKPLDETGGQWSFNLKDLYPKKGPAEDPPAKS